MGSITFLSSTSFTLTKVPEAYRCRERFAVDLPTGRGGDHLQGQFFYRNPQYAFKVPSPPGANTTMPTPVRISYEGPQDSAVCTFLVRPGHISRVLSLTSEMQSIPSPEVDCPFDT